MIFKTVDSEKGELAYFEREGSIVSASDFLDILFSSPADTIILRKEDLPDEFYDLKTKFAGEILQKLINYRRRMIVLGEFGNFSSKSWKDFVYESNKQGKFLFCSSIEEAIPLLK
ncbi:DUF4180 domain-containing protein [Leptospira sarikeiensis]|uniref:DUF4180 domain-containing protein n=1 Tax=Leptospira sarikeiensis TaxID=2484943 RepID=A0A4R9KBD3_9LEPT|nr:DUF4180 domain-containing protein [Leptospira sarikeiensis]TGL64058.1 DUF4180 domain-containing protein [Leptospira sarikeiensis]